MSPMVKSMQIIPVAGHDQFLLNLSGGHAPWFTRCVVLLEDHEGQMGLGEVPASAGIMATLEACRELVEGANVAAWKTALHTVRGALSGRSDDVRGEQTYDQRIAVHVITAIESALLDLHGQHLGVPVADLLGRFGRQRDEVEALGYLFFVADAAQTDLPYARCPSPTDSWDEVRTKEALTAEAIVRQARAAHARYGFRNFKLKAGVLEPAQEADCIRALRAAFPQARLSLDPNGAWSRAQAVETLAPLQSVLAYAEDPCGPEGIWSGAETMAEFRRQTGLSTATNMIATDFAQLRCALELHAVDIPLADCHFWTMQGAVMVGELCHEWGLTWGSHSNSHFDISLAMMTHVAAACPGPITAIDTHWIWQDGQRVTTAPLLIRDGRIKVPTAPGLGIQLDRARLDAAHDLYRTLPRGDRDDAMAMQYLIKDWKFDPKQPAMVR